MTEATIFEMVAAWGPSILHAHSLLKTKGETTMVAYHVVQLVRVKYTLLTGVKQIPTV